MKINYKKLGFCILIPLLVGGLSALITKNSFKLFDILNKPLLSPPGWLFPVVWTILFILMGIASYLVLEENKSNESALLYYLVQLAFNFFWSIIFFNLKLYVFASIWIIILLILIVITTIKFNKINKLASYLMIPYILWVSFATYLTIAIAILN